MRTARIVEITVLILYGIFVFTLEVIDYPSSVRIPLEIAYIVYNTIKLVVGIVKNKRKKKTGDGSKPLKKS